MLPFDIISCHIKTLIFRSGIYQSSDCKNCRNADGTVNRDDCPQDHEITIVGSGVENGVKFWKLKNSWGTGWGEGGFGKILRGTGHCGFAIDFSVPICTASDTPPTPASTAAPVIGGSGTVHVPIKNFP